MSTTGWTAEGKLNLQSKILDIAQKLEDALTAVRNGDRALAGRLVSELMTLKIEALTMYPHIVVEGRQDDIPYEILYESIGRFERITWDFTWWAEGIDRRPGSPRKPSRWEPWVNEIVGLIDEIRFMLDLSWPPGDPGRRALNDLLLQLERWRDLISQYGRGLVDHGPPSWEAEEIQEIIRRFFEAVSDAMSLAESYRSYHWMNQNLESVLMLIWGDEPLTDERKRLIDQTLDIIAGTIRGESSRVDSAPATGH